MLKISGPIFPDDETENTHTKKSEHIYTDMNNVPSNSPQMILPKPLHNAPSPPTSVKYSSLCNIVCALVLAKLLYTLAVFKPAVAEVIISDHSSQNWEELSAWRTVNPFGEYLVVVVWVLWVLGVVVMVFAFSCVFDGARATTGGNGSRNVCVMKCNRGGGSLCTSPGTTCCTSCSCDTTLCTMKGSNKVRFRCSGTVYWGKVKSAGSLSERSCRALRFSRKDPINSSVARVKEKNMHGTG